MRQLIAIICLFSFQFIFAQEVPENYQDLHMRINESPGKSVDKELEKLRKSNPFDPWVFWLSAINCKSEAISEKTVSQTCSDAYYIHAIAVDSTFSPAYYNLGLNYYYADNEKDTEALQLFTKAIQYNPNDCYSYLFRGKVNLRLKNYDRAMADYENVKACPDMFKWVIDQFLVEILYAQGKKAEVYQAIREARFADELGFGEDDFQLLLGALYEEMGEQENACKCYRNVKDMFEMIGMEVPKELEEKVNKCPEPKEE